MNRRTLLLGAAALGACAAVDRRGGESALLLRDCKIFTAPDAPAIERGSILLRGGRIAAVGEGLSAPAGARTIEGGFVTAGLWNSHVHFSTPALLHAERRTDAELTDALTAMFTRWGFTTVFDVASFLENTNAIRARVRSGAVKGPNILTVGNPFFPLNGTPFYVREFFRAENIAPPEFATVAEAVAQAERQLADGADGLKLFTGSIVGGDVGVLPMSLDMARAVAEAAHRAGKPVFAHPSNQAGLDVAIEAGVDILAHTAPMAGPWAPDFIARLRARNMALVPTFELFEIEARRFGAPPDAPGLDMRVARQQASAYARAGGEILFGTDVGYTEAFDTSREFALMAEAGFDFSATLAALTTAPARRFGFADRKGAITRGMDADLVVLADDPSRDVTAFARARQTIRGGEVVFDADAA